MAAVSILAENDDTVNFRILYDNGDVSDVSKPRSFLTSPVEQSEMDVHALVEWRFQMLSSGVTKISEALLLPADPIEERGAITAVEMSK